MSTLNIYKLYGTFGLTILITAIFKNKNKVEIDIVLLFKKQIGNFDFCLFN